MKNLATTLPALALTGALTFAVAPSAAAQSAEGGSSAAATESSAALPAPAPGQEDLPHLKIWEAGGEAGDYEDAVWYYHADGTHVVADVENVNADIAELGEDQMTTKEFADVAGYAQPQSGSQQNSSSLAGTSSEASQSGLTAESVLKLLATSSTQPMLPLAIVGDTAGQINDQEWYYNRDINFVVNSRELVDKDVASGQGGVMLTVDFARQLQRALPINVVLDQGSSAATVSNTADTGETNTNANGNANADAGSSANGALPGSSLPATETGNQTAGGSSATLGGETASQVVNAALGSSNGISANGSIEGGSSASDAARLALVALPAVLIIGGISYYLNQDGRTYVDSSSRTSSAPTAQERASSESLLSSNRHEVQRQSQAAPSIQVAANRQEAAAPQVRGISAETGSNSLAKGLVALLIASVLGAAAFHFGRKQLV
ncbi:hypothetical protein [uncultured Corynebacterium sp.]|uniref:hypothetical protein n=1 Tax=uncultured Corynebacterium sp. TaxID=159447 RepID=UPI0025997EFB|nr:hypothetical protein [uncultured Corynebacterium sp.]